MQNYQRTYDYIYEYWHEIYDIYARHAIAYLVTYYNISTGATVWDDSKLMGGPYEKIGSLSGLRWNRYLTLPVFFISETETTYTAEETGYLTSEKMTDFVIPSDYGIIPYPDDIIKLDQRYLVNNLSNDKFSLYTVQGIKKQSPADKTYYQVHCRVNQSRTTTEVDRQLDQTFVFFDYDKKIHTVPESVVLTRMLNKNEEIAERLTGMFDENSGFYYI